MMCSSTIIHSFCYVLFVLFITSTCASDIDSNELKNSLTEQQIGLNLPLYYDRFIRTTKFPRIGRSPSDIEELSYSNIDENDENSNENEFRLIKQRSVHFPRIGKRSVHFPRIGKRSVHFPRIGKRAFHNLLWASSLSNPHRMLDAQGRYHVNGYDYHIDENQPRSTTQYRGKRDISM